MNKVILSILSYYYDMELASYLMAAIYIPVSLLGFFSYPLTGERMTTTTSAIMTVILAFLIVQVILSAISNRYFTEPETA